MSLSAGATSTRSRSLHPRELHRFAARDSSRTARRAFARLGDAIARDRVIAQHVERAGDLIDAFAARHRFEEIGHRHRCRSRPPPAGRCRSRSASSSSPRVKFMLCCSATPWLIAMAPSIAWPPAPLAAPIRIAASIAAVVPSDMRLCARIERAMWRWRTCAVSWPSTLARSDSVSVSSIRPVLTQMKPPKVAKALISVRTHDEVLEILVVIARLRGQARAELLDVVGELRDPRGSGSDRAARASPSARSGYSSVLLRMAFSGEPMSGSWLADGAPVSSGRQCTGAAEPQQQAGQCRSRSGCSERAAQRG